MVNSSKHLLYWKICLRLAHILCQQDDFKLASKLLSDTCRSKYMSGYVQTRKSLFDLEFEKYLYAGLLKQSGQLAEAVTV